MVEHGYYHLPEVDGHLATVLQDGPDEEGGPGRETSLFPVGTVPQQQLVHMLKRGGEKERQKGVRTRWG